VILECVRLHGRQQKFAEKNHFNFPLICDTDRTIGTAYGSQRPIPRRARSVSAS